jgi:hypothetical protein
MFQGCGEYQAPISQGGYYYQHIYFGENLSRYMKRGIIDGCQTAQGNYQKLHLLFNDNREYNTGWFIGRNRCRKLYKE